MHGELWLMRHGETEWSLSGQHTSHTDLPLTPEGERRARALGQRTQGKNFTLVLSSPLRRALETARLAGRDPVIDPLLTEWDYGRYEGLTTAQIREQSPGWTVWSGELPDGESAAQVGARADQVIARALAAGGDVAICGHGHMLRVLAARWVGLPPDSGERFLLSTGTLSILGWERDTPALRVWNQTP